MTSYLNRRRLFGFLAAMIPTAVLSPRALAQCAPTRADVKGPFYLPNAPFRTALADGGEKGEALEIRGVVQGPDCTKPLANAVLDLWQADADGRYHNQSEQYRLRGQVRTNERGEFMFSTIMPGRYKDEGGFRPAHIHVTITHPDCQPLTTQIYFKGDPYLAPNDSCGSQCGSDDPARIVDAKPAKQGLQGTLAFVLRPNGEHAQPK